MVSKTTLFLAIIFVVCITVQLSSTASVRTTTRRPANSGWKVVTTTRRPITRGTTARPKTTRRPTLPTRPPVDKKAEAQRQQRKEIDAIIKAWNKQQGYSH